MFEIEARNPDLHEEEGAGHLDEILLSAMSAIYHSSLCDEEVNQATLTELVNRGILKEGEQPSPIH